MVVVQGSLEKGRAVGGGAMLLTDTHLCSFENTAHVTSNFLLVGLLNRRKRQVVQATLVSWRVAPGASSHWQLAVIMADQAMFAMDLNDGHPGEHPAYASSEVRLVAV